ncbi:MAG: hypothetical protein K0Q94_6083 [Paenibacillus sp.]|jgi:hypothetical protein|nr:hypothetical protein [Paenibacillus sp.]
MPKKKSPERSFYQTRFLGKAQHNGTTFRYPQYFPLFVENNGNGFRYTPKPGYAGSRTSRVTELRSAIWRTDSLYE